MRFDVSNNPLPLLQTSWWEDIIWEPKIWAAFGCHPHFADKFGDNEEMFLHMALSNPKTVALGEIGLDYFKK